MRILLYRGDGITEPWVRDFSNALPHAEIVVWREGMSLAAQPRCDYAVTWAPTPALLDQLAHVKAIFLTGAGVDALLKFGDALPPVPIVRLGDAGMAEQMAEYVAYATLRYFRRFDDYELQARQGIWNPLPRRDKADFTVGVLGLGRLGMPVLRTVRQLGFPVRGWSRSARDLPGVECYAGMEALDDFLAGTQLLVCMLPLTPETTNLLDRARLSRLPRGAYLVNVARGAQVAEPDLLALIRAGHIAGATLDVFRNEPLPAPHPFWSEPRITITPHISAITLREEAVQQIVAKIERLERGEAIDDVVDRARGY
ncbi:glyoxylate/hydroxypyruvate reductase A [Massilia sp. TW-1]|uniref:Glyoxylate/hydroxypyruvate reductase A n=1 Tax=Telluria antibiotica TaxID=2717319 RepID=A0ABX0PFR5_9BURK|nr:glyoxylate/hydroxypyruvate reductase A [Telluria antibiotica]NIA56256.1 glyoxylate/hydroxypyruvate reductase A [Telluria antibiotica]